MSDTVLTALIGLIGSISAAVIGALVTLHIHNSATTRTSETGQAADRARGEARPAGRRLTLTIPFTAISLILAVLFGVFLAQTLRGPTITPTPTPAPAAATPGATAAIPAPATATIVAVADTPLPRATAPPTATIPPAGPATATAPQAAPPTAPPAAPPTAPAPDTAVTTPTPAPADTPTAASGGPAAATATLPPGVFGPAARAEVTAGISLVISQMDATNGSLTWRGTIRNDSANPYTFQPDRADLSFQDSNGQPLGNGAQFNAPNSPIAAHATAAVTFYGSYNDLPAATSYIDLVINNLAPTGPLTFRRQLTLGSGPPATPGPYSPGQQVTLSPSVTLVISQMPVQNGGLAWRGTLRNGSGSPFNFRLGRGDVAFADSSGQALGNGSAQGNWPDGDVAPGASATLNFGSSYHDLAPGVQYIDLTITNLSGYGPFVFRRTLSSGPGPAATPAVFMQGDRAVLTPGVYLVITQMQVQVQDSSARWQGTLHNETNTPFNFRLESADVQFVDSSGQPLTNVQVQGNWPDGDVPAQSSASVSFNTYLGSSPPGGAYLDLVLANISGFGPFAFRHPLP